MVSTFTIMKRTFQVIPAPPGLTAIDTNDVEMPIIAFQLCEGGAEDGPLTELRPLYMDRRGNVSSALFGGRDGKFGCSTAGIQIVGSTQSGPTSTLASRYALGAVVTDGDAWNQFLAVLDRPVSSTPRIAKLFAELSLLGEPAVSGRALR